MAVLGTLSDVEDRIQENGLGGLTAHIGKHRLPMEKSVPAAPVVGATRATPVEDVNLSRPDEV